MSEATPSGPPPLRTPLYERHVAAGAKMVEFAGYAMPVQYPNGILAEHNHTRRYASLFDVSHMGQVSLWGEGAARMLEHLVPADLLEMPPWAMRYSQLTNEAGGIIDDLMVLNAGERLLLVVNASRKAVDVAHLEARLNHAVDVAYLPGRALIALQGPYAATALARHAPAAAKLGFMAGMPARFGKIEVIVTRSGYTGEDGFEIPLRTHCPR